MEERSYQKSGRSGLDSPGPGGPGWSQEVLGGPGAQSQAGRSRLG